MKFALVRIYQLAAMLLITLICLGIAPQAHAQTMAAAYSASFVLQNQTNSTLTRSSFMRLEGEWGTQPPASIASQSTGSWSMFANSGGCNTVNCPPRGGVAGSVVYRLNNGQSVQVRWDYTSYGNSLKVSGSAVSSTGAYKAITSVSGTANRQVTITLLPK